MRPRMLALTLVALLGGPLAAQEVNVGGRQIDLQITGGHVKGELLAIDRDSAWVLVENRVTSVAMTMVRSASVSRHKLTGQKAVTWGLAVGAISGLALTAACSSVEDAGCAAVLPGSVLIGLALGGIASASLGPSSRWRFQPVDPGALARFARFPQGLPSGALQLLGDASPAP
jgi:hypothetical protein